VSCLCEFSGCSLIARIHVALDRFDGLAVCSPRRGEVLWCHLFRRMRWVQPPHCFVDQCRCAAVAIVRQGTCDPHRVRPRELNALSWSAASRGARARGRTGHRG
jgi:hypothetical protein